VNKNLKKNLIISIVLATAIYIGASVYSDFGKIVENAASFNWILLPLILICSYLNYIFRFLKWHHYVKQLELNVPLKISFRIFMSGLVMSISPGKMGEVLKSVMIKQTCGYPISKTAPIVLSERITDILSLVLLSSLGGIVFGTGGVLIIFTGTGFVFLVIFLVAQKPRQLFIKIITFVPFVKKFINHIQTSFDSASQLLKPIPLIKMTLLSIVSWFFECLGFYLILSGFSQDTTLFAATYIYSFATIAGSVSMLPAGLGVTEGSLGFLLVRFGSKLDIAVASTILLRTVTLWFAVILGIFHIFAYQRIYGKIAESE